MTDPNATPATDTTTAPDWITLADAVALLGVPASTVRRWADQGLLQVVRTPGGHRRFARHSVLTLRARVPAAAGLPALPAADLPASPWRLDPAQLARQTWHARLAMPAEAGRMRGLGQRLLGLLIQYLTRYEEDARFLAEGREIGMAYGAEAAQAAAPLHDVVAAFVFFRSSFLALALHLPAPVQATDAEAMTRLWGRADRFMNEVLLGTIAGYETGRTGRAPEEPGGAWT